jgi:hypothetical protein
MPYTYGFAELYAELLAYADSLESEREEVRL